MIVIVKWLWSFYTDDDFITLDDDLRIDDKSQVKVADFGLSHELHDREYYSSRNRRAKLPIKWMALESLENYVFTIKSDVVGSLRLLWLFIRSLLL